MTATTATRVPVITTDLRVHTSATCRRATRPVLDQLAGTMTATPCTSCKPSPRVVDQAVAAIVVPVQVAGPALFLADTDEADGGERYEDAEPLTADDLAAVDVPTVDVLDLDDEGRPMAGPASDQPADDWTPAAPAGQGEQVRADRAAGLTVLELAQKYGLPAAQVRSMTLDVVKEVPVSQSKTLAPKSRGKKVSPKAPAVKADKAAPVAKPAGKLGRGGLPPVTQDDLDKLMAMRAEGKSFRAMRDAMPHLERAHSSLRAIVLKVEAGK